MAVPVPSGTRSAGDEELRVPYDRQQYRREQRRTVVGA
jgi:hypothetical protein